MEVKHRITVMDGNPEFTILKELFDNLNIKYEYYPNDYRSMLICLLSDSDPKYEVLKPHIYTQHVGVQTGMYFSPKDYEESEWFRVITSESLHPKGKEDYRDATYDLANWCDKCGLGASQNRPFRLSRDFQQKRDKIYGLHNVFDELFCRPEIKSLLDENGFSGLSYFHPVYQKSGKPIETTYQIKIETITSPGLFIGGLNLIDFSIDRNLWTTQSQYARYCPFCKGVKFRYPERDVIKFDRRAFDNVPEIIKSYELFGYGLQTHRLILVSKRFYDLMQRNKIGELTFTPIRLV